LRGCGGRVRRRRSGRGDGGENRQPRRSAGESAETVRSRQNPISDDHARDYGGDHAGPKPASKARPSRLVKEDVRGNSAPTDSTSAAAARTPRHDENRQTVAQSQTKQRLLPEGRQHLSRYGHDRQPVYSRSPPIHDDSFATRGAEIVAGSTGSETGTGLLSRRMADSCISHLPKSNYNPLFGEMRLVFALASDRIGDQRSCFCRSGTISIAHSTPLELQATDSAYPGPISS